MLQGGFATAILAGHLKRCSWLELENQWYSSLDVVGVEAQLALLHILLDGSAFLILQRETTVTLKVSSGQLSGRMSNRPGLISARGPGKRLLSSARTNSGALQCQLLPEETAVSPSLD